MNDTAQFEVQARVLLDAIKVVKPAMAKDEARPILTTILLEAEGEGVRLVAADNYRIFIQNIEAMDIEAMNAEWPQRAIPGWRMRTVMAFLSEQGKTRVTVAALPDNRLTLATSLRDSLTIQCVDGQYPNYRAVESLAMPTSEPLAAVNPRLFGNLPEAATLRVYAGGRLDPINLVNDSGFRAVIMPVRTAT